MAPTCHGRSHPNLGGVVYQCPHYIPETVRGLTAVQTCKGGTATADSCSEATEQHRHIEQLHASKERHSCSARTRPRRAACSGNAQKASPDCSARCCGVRLRYWAILVNDGSGTSARLAHDTLLFSRACPCRRLSSLADCHFGAFAVCRLPPPKTHRRESPCSRATYPTRILRSHTGFISVQNAKHTRKHTGKVRFHRRAIACT